VRRRYRIAGAAWLFIGLQLLAGAGGPLGVELCVADDGHTSIELAHAELPCAGDVRRHHSPARTVDAVDLERHPCRDVPLLESRSHTGSSENRLPPATSTALRAPPPCGLGPTWSTTDHRRAFPPTLDAIRTVVLVI